MHNAPSVIFPVGRCALYAGLLGALAALGGLVLAAWWIYAPVPTWAGSMASAVWLMWVAFALGSWRRMPQGRIAWRATERRAVAAMPGQWHWLSAACPEGAPIERVELVLDLQVCLLLRLHNADSLTRWVWVERNRDPAHWTELRRALWAARA